MESESEKLLRFEKENTILRGMVAKILPCHYCGLDDISKCDYGFPGCSLADDLLCGEEEGYRAVITRSKNAIDFIDHLVGACDVIIKEYKELSPPDRPVKPIIISRSHIMALKKFVDTFNDLDKFEAMLHAPRPKKQEENAQTKT